MKEVRTLKFIMVMRTLIKAHEEKKKNKCFVDECACVKRND